jgi:hypothetical protein
MSAAEFDVNSFLNEESVAPAAGNFDVDAFLNDTSPMVDKPAYANGASPTRALNQPAPSMTADLRAQLGRGNERGKFSKLKELYGAENVAAASDGTFKIKDGDAWYQVDPNLEAVDPWKATAGVLAGGAATFAGYGAAGVNILANMITGKGNLSTNPQQIADGLLNEFLPKGEAQTFARETVSELGENEALIATTGASVGVGLATGGASLMAQGLAQGAVALGMEGSRISMGAAEGTYDIDPEEYVKDLATETLFAASGAVILPGVKPGLKWLAESGAAKKLGELAAKLPGPSKEAIYNGWGSLTRMGGETTQRIFERGDKVQRWVNQGAGKTTQDAVDTWSRQITSNVRNMASAATEARTELYNKGQASLRAAAKADTKIDLKALTNPFIEDLQNAGLVKVAAREGTQMRGEFVDGKFLSRQAGLELDFQLVPYEQFKAQAIKSGELPDLAFSEESYKGLQKMFTEVSALRDPALSRKTGFEAVENLGKASRVLSDITHELRETGIDNNLNVLERLATSADSKFRKGALDALGGEGSELGRVFVANKEAYRAFKNTFGPLEKAALAEQQGNKEAFASLGRTISGRTNRAETRGDILTGVQFLKNNGIKSSESLQYLVDDIADINAARNLTESIDKAGPRLKTAGLMAGGVGVANPLAGGLIAGGALASAPQIPAAMSRIGYGIMDLARGNPGMMSKLLMNPATGSQIPLMWIQAGQAEQQTNELMMSRIPGAQ